MWSFIYAVGCLACCVLGVFGRASSVKSVVVGMLLSDLLLSCIVIIGYHADEDVREAGAGWAWMPAKVFLIGGLVRLEAHVVPVLFGFVVLAAAAHLAENMAIFPNDGWWQETVQSSDMAVPVFVLLLATLRRVSIMRAMRMVRADRRGYNAAWAEVVQSAENCRILCALRSEAEHFSEVAAHSAERVGAGRVERPRQLNRFVSSELVH